MNSLQILQRQLLGSEPFTRTLNSSRDLKFFIYVGTLSHSFGSVENAVLIPYLSVHGGMLQLHLH